jgi:hypothetical protein
MLLSVLILFLQAADRVHRIGQQYPCKITFLQVKNSMDEALTQLQKNKRMQANLTLRGIGTVQGSGGGALGIRDVYNIMAALDSIFEPAILANPQKFPEQIERLRQLNKTSDSKRGAFLMNAMFLSFVHPLSQQRLVGPRQLFRHSSNSLCSNPMAPYGFECVPSRTSCPVCSKCTSTIKLCSLSSTMAIKLRKKSTAA